MRLSSRTPTPTGPERVRIDVVSIFPTFFDVLEVSLLGKGRQAGILDVRVHDLREFTHDRHRTVDDTPYGTTIHLNIIPHTWDVTTFAGLTAGTAVNIEIDTLARYLKRMQDVMAG
mgnify:CR=1 FL=1